MNHKIKSFQSDKDLVEMFTEDHNVLIENVGHWRTAFDFDNARIVVQGEQGFYDMDLADAQRYAPNFYRTYWDRRQRNLAKPVGERVKIVKTVYNDSGLFKMARKLYHKLRGYENREKNVKFWLLLVLSYPVFSSFMLRHKAYLSGKPLDYIGYRNSIVTLAVTGVDLGLVGMLIYYLISNL